MDWSAMRSFEQALDCLHDRSELRVDDLQTPLRVTATRMIASEQLQVAIDSIQRRPNFVCERSSDLTDCCQPFRVRETLLRANQIPISSAQLGGREVNFSNKLVIQAANLAQQLFALARSGRDIVHHLIEAAGNFS